MANVNAPSGQTPAMAPPLRTDDQILPHIRAFTASFTIPSIYIQQFWDTILYDKKARCYRCQLDEQWFVLTKETLREALQITPVNNNQAFAAPPSINGLIDFVNQLGYPKLVKNLSNRRHRFYPRPDSPLHLPNEESVLGYLKFSAKGTKREVFGMPIPGSLITVEIHQASYYREYLAKVAQHRRYLAGKTGGVQDPPASKPTEPARKPKTTTPREPSRPSVSIPVADEDTDYQKVLEESMKDDMLFLGVRSYQWSSGNLTKVTEEQVSHDLLSLQKHKKTSLADQYIFQRRVSEPTGSSRHNESLYALLGQSDSEEESEKVMLGAEEGGQDEGQARPDPDAQVKDQTGSDVDSEHMDLDVADVSPQPSTEQLDEGFTATAYPKVSIAVSEVVTDAVDWAMKAPLRNRFRDVPKADMKEILHQRMWESESYKSHKDHMQLFEALEKSMNRDHFDELAQELAEARKKKKKSHESPKTPPGSPSHQPPPPPPPAGPSDALGGPLELLD
nr:histone deacetylase 14 [Tanacetum cinerariifolium]